jgi:hypothetical protein
MPAEILIDWLALDVFQQNARLGRGVDILG